MREVLIQVTQTLSEMDDGATPYDGGDTVKSRMSNANRKMIESKKFAEKAVYSDGDNNTLQVPKRKK